MGCIAGEQRTAHAESRRAALVHAIRRIGDDPVGRFRVRKENGVPFCDPSWNIAFRQVCVLFKGHAPQILPTEASHHCPVDGVSHHVRRFESIALEIVTDVGGDESLRPGVPFERQGQEIADGAACAVGTHHPSGTKILAPARRFHAQYGAGSVLGESDQARAPTHRGPGQRVEMLQDQLRKQVLTEMSVVRVWGIRWKRICDTSHLAACEEVEGKALAQK